MPNRRVESIAFKVRRSIQTATSARPRISWSKCSTPARSTSVATARRSASSTRGVLEYWIVDWRPRQVEVYRRADADLVLARTLREADAVASPLLPGFSYQLDQLFADLPPTA